jgi:RNA polymerase sigma factor (sigma-70 family)
MPDAVNSTSAAVPAELPPTGPSQTAALWGRYVSGEEDAARQLFERFLQRLTALARSRLSARLAARVDADDVVMSAYRSLFIGGRDGRFSVSQAGDFWRLLVEITMHKLYRQAAHHLAGKRSVRAEQNGALAAADGQQPLSHEPSPEAAAMLAEELSAIMAQLKPAARRAIELHLQGESLGAIAAELGCSLRTVRRQLAQARQVVQRRAIAEARDGNRPLVAEERNSLRRATPPRRTSGHVADAEAPFRFDDFLLQKQLGTGATGKVYQALHKATGRALAVKYLKKAYVRHPQVVERFLHEARLVAQLQHEHIVRIQGLGRTPNRGYFIAMDLMSGGDLARRIADGKVATAETVRWMSQVAAAISYAHQRGVIHCDLKPSNILLSGENDAQVTDFGLAVSPRAELLPPLALGGTPSFMAPEQIDAVWGPITPRTDVFGLGAVLFALLTGQPPHTGRRTADVLARSVARLPVQFPTRAEASLPPELVDLCVRALAKDPAERNASAQEFAEALAAVAAKL